MFIFKDDTKQKGCIYKELFSRKLEDEQRERERERECIVSRGIRVQELYIVRSYRCGSTSKQYKSQQGRWWKEGKMGKNMLI